MVYENQHCFDSNAKKQVKNLSGVELKNYICYISTLSMLSCSYPSCDLCFSYLFMPINTSFPVSPGHLDEQGFSGKTFLRFCTAFFVAWFNQFVVRNFYKIGSSSQETKCLEKEQLLFAGARGTKTVTVATFPDLLHFPCRKLCCGIQRAWCGGLGRFRCENGCDNLFIVFQIWSMCQFAQVFLQHVVLDRYSISGAQFVGDISLFQALKNVAVKYYKETVRHPDPAK